MSSTTTISRVHQDRPGCSMKRQAERHLCWLDRSRYIHIYAHTHRERHRKLEREREREREMYMCVYMYILIRYEGMLA
jgi:hypothetical protein